MKTLIRKQRITMLLLALEGKFTENSFIDIQTCESFKTSPDNAWTSGKIREAMTEVVESFCDHWNVDHALTCSV